MALLRTTSVFIHWGTQYSELLIENIGCREGSVLGPILFLIFYDDVASFIMAISLSTPIFLAGVKTCVLLFADDTTLFSTSWDDCTALFKRYLEYTNDNGLIVNTSKSHGMAFRVDNRRATIGENGVLHTRGFRSQWQPRSLRHNGKTISFVEKFKYVGLIFHSDGSLAHMVQTVLAAGRRALGMLQGSLMSLGYIPYRYALSGSAGNA